MKILTTILTKEYFDFSSGKNFALIKIAESTPPPDYNSL
jgi:hypothetical protein